MSRSWLRPWKRGQSVATNELLGWTLLDFQDAAMRWAMQYERELRRKAMRSAAMEGDPLATFGWTRA